MANNNQVELVVTVEVDKANQSIKSVNANLSGMEASVATAARGASAGMDHMTASMVKGAAAGHLLAEAIKKAIEFAKEWTIEAAKEAAHLDRAERVARGLAKAHGDGADAAERAIEAIRNVGYTAKDATTNVQKLIIADIGLDKAKGIAKIAKDAAALSTDGLSAAEAFEKIILAIETGQSRGLRSMSLFPDLAKAEQVATLQAQLHGKTITENEVKLIRYNAIVEAAKNIQGAAASASGTFDAEMKKLSRELKDLKEDVGKAFQEDLRAIATHLSTLVHWLKDNTVWIEKFGQMAIWLAGVLTTYAIATKIGGITDAVLGLGSALTAHPIALLITGVVAAGAVIYKEYNDMQENRERWIKEAQDKALRQQLFSGQVKVDDLRKRGMTDDQIRSLIAGRQLAPGEGADLGAGLPKLGGNQPDPEALRLQLEIQKRQRENALYFGEKATSTRPTTLMNNGKPVDVPLSGYAKDVAELNSDIAKRTTFVDDKGVHQVPLTKAAWDAVLEYASNKFTAFKQKFSDDNRKEVAEIVKGIEEEAHRRNEWENRRFQQRIQNDAEIAERNIDHLKDVYAFEEQRAGFERDAKLRRLDGMDAQTIQQHVAVEQQKAAIEIEYLEKVHKVKQALYDLDTRRMLLEEELTLKRLGYKAEEIQARIAELTQQRKEIRDQADETNDEAIRAARENAANRSAQLVREHNKTIFESLKQQAGGVFDALLQKSQSVWSAIGNSLKTALLTAIKDVVTSRVAGLLMSLLYGTSVSFAAGGGLAGTPVFSGGGSAAGVGAGLVGMLGGGGRGQIVQVVGGSDGGTGGGPVQVINAGGASGSTGGGLAIPGLGGSGNMLFGKPATIWQNLKGFAGFGNVTTDSWGGKWVTVGNQSINIDSLGGKLNVAGRSPAAGMAGMGLFMYGLSNRSAKGDASLIGGGALTGFQMGGPWGAVGGAAAGGFIAGLRRGGWAGWAETGFNPIAGILILAGSKKWLAGAAEKAREKIRDLYGVDIEDRKVLQQIVDIAKQTYAGNLDMAIRTQQVRDLIQMYAMATGKQVKGMPATPHPLDLVQAGGSLYQSPGYSNGTPLPGLGGLPVFDSIGAGVASGGGLGTTVVNLQIDSTTVGSVVLQNGRVVAQGVTSAMKANVGRRSIASLQLSPGLVTQ